MKTPTLIDYTELYGVELYPFQKELIEYIDNLAKSGKLAKCSFLSTARSRPNLFFELMKRNDPEEIETPEEGTEGGADTEIG